MTTMKRFLFLIFIVCTVVACTDKGGNNPPVNPPPPAGDFIKGADVSWLTEMEAAGKKFYNSAGTEQECMALLKGLGMNAVRLRAWVNPSPAWNNTADVVAKALRAKALGLKILLDIH